jgi:hypothetical protein
MKKITKSILAKIDAIKDIRIRRLDNGDWVVYNNNKEVLYTVSKDDVSSATKRMMFRKAQKDRRKKAEW